MKKLLIDDTTILIGMSSNDNDDILKLAKKQDQNSWWFHLESVPSAHIIVFIKDPKPLLSQVKKLLLEYTPKAPQNQHIIYTKVKNVSRTNIPGTVVSKHTKRY